MINEVDLTVQHLLELEFGNPLPFDLSFAVPDRAFVPVSASKNTLNCYLYDIHEDRELRGAVQPTVRPLGDGTVEQVYPPARIKLRYCITAWSPTILTPGTQPAVDEHALLGAVLAVLLKHVTIPPAVLAGSLAGQQPPLPTTTAFPEPVRSSWDFWNAVGGPLRPSLEYAITFSLAFQPPLDRGPVVTTALLKFGGGDQFYMIGGVVWDASVPRAGVPGAWVRVDQTGQIFVTDAAGRFAIPRIAGGAYTLRARAVSFTEGVRAITVPQPDGQYDIQLALL